MIIRPVTDRSILKKGGTNMEELRFDGRVAVITGVGNVHGLGFAYARLLGERGAKVVVSDLNVEDEVMEQLKEAGAEAVRVKCDVAKMADAQNLIDTAVKNFGRVDIVINNAGVCKFVTLDEEEEDLFDFTIKVNVNGSRNIIKAALPLMMAQHYGRIINTTSSAGMYGLGRSFAYSTAKGAVYGMTRSLAIWGEEYGIKVNGIAPSATTAGALNGVDKATRDAMLASPIAPAACAPAVAYLAHEKCPVTGKILETAGGGTGEIFVGTTYGVMSVNNTPEFICENWDRVVDKGRYEVVWDVLAPDSMLWTRLSEEH